jgi:hypothetical protein
MGVSKLASVPCIPIQMVNTWDTSTNTPELLHSTVGRAYIDSIRNDYKYKLSKCPSGRAQAHPIEGTLTGLNNRFYLDRHAR